MKLCYRAAASGEGLRRVGPPCGRLHPAVGRPAYGTHVAQICRYRTVARSLRPRGGVLRICGMGGRASNLRLAHDRPATSGLPPKGHRQTIQEARFVPSSGQRAIFTELRTSRTRLIRVRL